MSDLQVSMVFPVSCIGTDEKAVSARTVSEWLEVSSSNFSKWFKKSVANASLDDGVDYILLVQQEEQDKWGGHNKTDYALTADAAKHIVMVSNKEKSKEVRQYFIDVERKARALAEEIREDWERRLDKAIQKTQMLRLHEVDPDDKEIYRMANVHVNQIVSDLFGAKGLKKETMNDEQLKLRARILSQWVDTYEVKPSISHCNMITRLMFGAKQVGKNAYLNKVIEQKK